MKKLIFLVTLIAVVVVAWFALDLGHYLNFEYVKAEQAQWRAAFEREPALFIAGYFVIYVLVTALSIPGATVMTLLAGALFGVVMGTAVVSFASTFGATLAFLLSRFVARDAVQKRFAAQLKTINDGIAREGGFYLFTLRLLPIFPFFLINIVMGLTPLSAWQFYWISQLGMLAGTVVYVNAGTQLAQLQSVSGILSPSLILSFALLGLLPLAAKKTVSWLRTQRAHE